MSGTSEEVVVTFKKKTRKNIRQRRTEEEEAEEHGDEDEIAEKVELYKELRKLKERPHGVSTVTLALGKKSKPDDEMSNTDPFKTATGGMIDMAVLNSGKYQTNDDAYDTGIGTQFSAETNTRDEDAEMLKYIESKLQEYKKAQDITGNGSGGRDGTSDEGPIVKFLSPEEAAMLSVPEHLRKSGSSHRSEEMLSNQMLNGIPEVDLGIEVKIKNIEATEEAKQKILRDRLNKKEGPSHFVPTNMAVNFVQHNRFNIEDPTGISAHKRPRKEKEPEKPKKVVVVGAEPEEVGSGSVTGAGGGPGTSAGPGAKEKGDKATDDFHFEKFKKQFRRY